MNTTAYAIETAPIPAIGNSRIGIHKATKYPFRLLKKGQFFKVPNGNRNSLSATATIRGRELGAVFAVRALGDGVIGVWRVK